MADIDLDSAEPTRVELEVVESGDDVATLKLAGELDMTNVDKLTGSVEPVLARAPKRLVVDITDLRFADSSAIALWVKWAGAVGELELRGSSTLLRRIVESMGLADTLRIA